MTKSAFMFRDLSERERHNREDERLNKAKNTISLITGLLSSLSRPAAALLGKAGTATHRGSEADKKMWEQLSNRKQSGERLSKEDYSLFLKLDKLFGGNK